MKVFDFAIFYGSNVKECNLLTRSFLGENYAIIREGRITFLENDRRQIVPPDQVYSLLVVCYSLFLQGNKLYDVMFIHQVYFGKFLSSHAFTNLGSCQLESHVCRDCKSLYK